MIMSLCCLVKQRIIVLLGTTLMVTNAGNVMAQQPVANNSADFFHAALDVKGKGVCKEENGMLVTRDAYASFGNQQWSDYEFTFRARTAAGESEVQLWSGFREYNRDDRYIIGLRGGLQDNLYLGRLGYQRYPKTG